MVGFFMKDVYPCTSTALSFNKSCTAWPLLPEDLNDLPNDLNGLSSFIFVFLNWDTLKGVIFRYLVVSRFCKSTTKLFTCLTLDTCFMLHCFSGSGEKGWSEVYKPSTRAQGIWIKHQSLPQASCPSQDKPHPRSGRWGKVPHLLCSCLVTPQNIPAVLGTMLMSTGRLYDQLEPHWW